MAANNNGVIASPAQKSRLKAALLLGMVLLLAIGLSVAGTLWFLGEDSGRTDDHVVSPPDTFVPAQYMVVDRPVVTAIRHPGRQRYIQVHLAFESTQAPALEAAQTHLPLLRNALISELGQLEFIALQTPEGRQALPERLLTVVNETLAAEEEPTLDRVLLRNFVIQ